MQHQDFAGWRDRPTPSPRTGLWLTTAWRQTGPRIARDSIGSIGVHTQRWQLESRKAQNRSKSRFPPALFVLCKNMKAMRHFHYERPLHLSYNTTLTWGNLAPGRDPASGTVHTSRKETPTRTRCKSKISDSMGQELMVESVSRNCHRKAAFLHGYGHWAGHRRFMVSYFCRPGRVFGAAVASKQALPVGQETGYLLPCPR